MQLKKKVGYMYLDAFLTFFFFFFTIGTVSPLESRVVTLICWCCLPVKLLCGLEASVGAVDEVLSSALGVTGDTSESSDDLEAESEEDENESKSVRKKTNKIKGTYSAHIMWVCNSHEGGIF